MSSDTSHHPSPLERIAHEAAAWILRSDRGLSAAEQDAFSIWLGADPRHGMEIARHRRHWNRLDTLADWRVEHSKCPNPDLLAPPVRRRLWRFIPAGAGLTAAAAIALTWALWEPTREPAGSVPAPAIAHTSLPASKRVLPDGSIIELNRDAIVAVDFSAGERRVTLERGEAHFAVARDPARPFVVRASGVDVRAVGTVFNVRVDATAVEVLVTEGSVQVNAPARPLPGEYNRRDGLPAGGRLAPAGQILTARQRAVVLLADESVAPQVATLTIGEIERVLAWQHRLLDFTATPLGDIVAEFNRRNVAQLILIDAELASVRITASFRSDNIDGFLRLLEAGFGARVERRGDSEILLRKVYPPLATP